MVLLIVLFIVGIPIFILWFYCFGVKNLFKYAEEVIEKGYKGIRLPLYKYDELITALDGLGERGKRLANELRLIRDGKVSSEKQLEKELDDV